MSKGPKPKKLGGIDLIAQEVVDAAHASIMETWAMAAGDTVIERLFFTALVAQSRIGGRVKDVILKVPPGRSLEQAKDAAESAGEIHRAVIVQSQVQIAGWRVDFLLHYMSIESRDPIGAFRSLIIECDGHDYHERTKDQAARDRSRDRTAQYEGIPVLRFTGSELWRNPIGCADEALAFMERG